MPRMSINFNLIIKGLNYSFIPLVRLFAIYHALGGDAYKLVILYYALLGAIPELFTLLIDSKGMNESIYKELSKPLCIISATVMLLLFLLESINPVYLILVYLVFDQLILITIKKDTDSLDYRYLLSRIGIICAIYYNVFVLMPLIVIITLVALKILNFKIPILLCNKSIYYEIKLSVLCVLITRTKDYFLNDLIQASIIDNTNYFLVTLVTRTVFIICSFHYGVLREYYSLANIGNYLSKLLSIFYLLSMLFMAIVLLLTYSLNFNYIIYIALYHSLLLGFENIFSQVLLIMRENSFFQIISINLILLLSLIIIKILLFGKIILIENVYYYLILSSFAVLIYIKIRYIRSIY